MHGASEETDDMLRIEVLVAGEDIRGELRLAASTRHARVSPLPGRLAVSCDGITIEIPLGLVERLVKLETSPPHDSQRLSP
jgi:hypothetical protein